MYASLTLHLVEHLATQRPSVCINNIELHAVYESNDNLIHYWEYFFDCIAQ